MDRGSYAIQSNELLFFIDSLEYDDNGNSISGSDTISRIFEAFFKETIETVCSKENKKTTTWDCINADGEYLGIGYLSSVIWSEVESNAIKNSVNVKFPLTFVTKLEALYDIMTISYDNLKEIADAIRSKGKTSDKLVFPDGFTEAINKIPTISVSTSSDTLIINTK